VALARHQRYWWVAVVKGRLLTKNAYRIWFDRICLTGGEGERGGGVGDGTEYALSGPPSFREDGLRSCRRIVVRLVIVGRRPCSLHQCLR
jgi:hypothetical protein